MEGRGEGGASLTFKILCVYETTHITAGPDLFILIYVNASSMDPPYDGPTV